MKCKRLKQLCGNSHFAAEVQKEKAPSMRLNIEDASDFESLTLSRFGLADDFVRLKEKVDFDFRIL